MAGAVARVPIPNNSGDDDDYTPPKSTPDNPDMETDPYAEAYAPLTGIAGLLGYSPQEFQEMMIRLGIIILGSALILIGVSMIISGSKTASGIRDAAVSTAVDLIPAGKVAKIAKKVT